MYISYVWLMGSSLKAEGKFITFPISDMSHLNTVYESVVSYSC